METTNTVLNGWPKAPLRSTVKNQQNTTVPPVVVSDQATLHGVYKTNDGMYRASFRPKGGARTWYNLGYFVCPHAAAYVFNIYALTNEMAYLVNHGLSPNWEEVRKWRDRKEENKQRERNAHTIYLNTWSKPQ